MKKHTTFQKVIIPILVFALVLSSLSPLTTYAAKRDRTAPKAPTNLRATAITETSITLAWNTSTDNVKVTSYDIYKNNTLISSTTSTTFTVNNLNTNTTYQFYVKAKDGSENVSTASSALTITTLGSIIEPTTTPTPTQPPTLTPAPTTTPSPTPTPTVSPTIVPSITPVPTTGSNKVVGYYAAWSAYSQFTPDQLDVSKLTHINYAFANISSDLKISLGYPDVDFTNFAKLRELKKINPSLKTLISVGGWSWSSRFSDIALTDATRTAFANSCVEFITTYGFDGVDLDWEYPVSGGLSTNIRRPEDKQNFTLLIKKIREKLDAKGIIDNKHYLLTFAGASGNWYINNIELNLIQQYIDYANIMTYDIHGSWDSYTDFNAPLYANTDITNQDKWSVDQSITAWIQAGIPANKLVLGVPFYGYIYKQVSNINNGLYQSYSGAQSISYANIAANYLSDSTYIRYFHEPSMVPWLFNGSTFISYDDEISMTKKASYIKSKALAGAAIWELSQDPNRVLLNALHQGLQ